MLPKGYANREAVLAKYLHIARQQGSYCGPDWPDYVQATNLFLEEELKTRSRSTLQALQDDMGRDQDQWLIKNNRPPLMPEVIQVVPQGVQK